ncbi:hypothetical protein OROGR_027143 [Orobanche gracilis]
MENRSSSAVFFVSKCRFGGLRVSPFLKVKKKLLQKARETTGRDLKISQDGLLLRSESRNSESLLGMRGGHSNGVRGLVSPERGDHKKGGTSGNYNSTHHHNYKHNNKKNNNIINSISYHNDSRRHHGGGGDGGSGSFETAHKGGSSSGGGGDTIATVCPPKFVIALTNKEKEEDFMAIKGTKLPQRPKKRAKLIQRTLSVYCFLILCGKFLVSPGAWLCDLTLERCEVREKKVSKKRPRGLKAMGNMESDSE